MEDVDMIAADTFRGKRVLVTGHTGFKGAWLSIWLEMLGAEVIGLALDPESDKGVFTSSGIGQHIRDHRADIRDLDGLCDLFRNERPEVVFHLAAQALVLESYRDPVGTFDVNTMGTVNVLEAIRRTPSVRAAVMVTTDKCYENRETHHPYVETDALGGYDPYSASKGAAEIVIGSYLRSFFLLPDAPGIASARSGNVIGGGDRSADRLVPDLVRAVEQGRPLSVRHPGSIRPWQHVLEPLHGYLLLAERLLHDPRRFAGPWNFGPAAEEARTVGQLATAMFQGLGGGAWEAVAGEDMAHEAGILLLDSSKARTQLGWEPRLSFERTVELTAAWYRDQSGGQVLQRCRAQIEAFQDHGDQTG